MMGLTRRQGLSVRGSMMAVNVSRVSFSDSFAAISREWPGYTVRRFESVGRFAKSIEYIHVMAHGGYRRRL